MEEVQLVHLQVFIVGLELIGVTNADSDVSIIAPSNASLQGAAVGNFLGRSYTGGRSSPSSSSVPSGSTRLEGFLPRIRSQHCSGQCIVQQSL